MCVCGRGEETDDGYEEGVVTAGVGHKEGGQ